MKSTATLIPVLILAGCSAPPICEPNPRPEYAPGLEKTEARREAMIGEWVGETSDENGTGYHFRLHRYEDGTFKIRFTELDVSEPIIWEESGYWAISGPIYFVTTEIQSHFTESKTFYYDAYHIIRQEYDEIEYASYAPQRRFVIRRRKEK